MDKCQYCKEPAELTREHVIPISKGGCNHAHNIIHVCESCNHKRGNMPMYQWIQLNDKYFTDIVARKSVKAVDCLIKDYVRKRAHNSKLSDRVIWLENKLNKYKTT